MPILKHHKTRDYTSLSNTLLQDPTLSYEARGLLSELLSRPPNWKVRKSQLITLYCKKDKLNRIFKELKEKGFLRIELKREGGKIIGNEWNVSDEPLDEKERLIRSKDAKESGFAGRRPHRSSVDQQLQKKDNIKRKENPSLSSPHEKLEDEKVIKESFDNWWSFYPKRCGANSKQAALRCYKARRKEGHTPSELLDGVQAYQAFCGISMKTGTEFVMMASKFIGRDKHFSNNWRQQYEQQRNNPKRENDTERSARINNKLADIYRKTQAGEDVLANSNIW